MNQVLNYFYENNIIEVTRSKLYLLANFLMVYFGFILFVDHGGSKKTAIIILLIWLITGEYKKKIKKILKNPIAMSFLVFIGLFILGLLWTENFYAGRKILERPLLYLIVPLMVSMYDKRFLKYYVLAIVAAILYTSILTILIEHGLLDMKYTADESPFVNRVYLAGMLIFGYSYLFSKIHLNNSFVINIFLGIAVSMIVYTLIISGSRMGYINIIIATFIMVLYKYKPSKIQIMGLFTFLVLVTFAAYNLNPKVKTQVDKTSSVLIQMDLKSQIFGGDVSKRTSLTCRFEFWYYAYEMGQNHFPLGVGTGDGILELERYIGKKETKKLFEDCQGAGSGQFNPHNMYIFMFMQFGILGVLVLFWMLYVHVSESLKSQSISFIILVLTTILTLFSLSELFTSKFFIPFYGYATIVMYLISKESKEDKTLIPWK